MKKTIIFILLVGIIGFWGLYSIRQGNIKKQIEWNTLFTWTGIPKLPDWAINKEIDLAPGSHATYVAKFDAGSKENIVNWMKNEPALLEVPVNYNDKTLPVFILTPQGGSSYDEVKFDLVNYKVTITATAE